MMCRFVLFCGYGCFGGVLIDVCCLLIIACCWLCAVSLVLVVARLCSCWFDCCFIVVCYVMFGVVRVRCCLLLVVCCLFFAVAQLM